MSDESVFQENGEVWAGEKRELTDKLDRHYGVSGIHYYDDWHHEGRDEVLEAVLTYIDGEVERFITDEVFVYGHGPSGAVGVKREDLPSEERVRSVLKDVGEVADG